MQLEDNSFKAETQTISKRLGVSESCRLRALNDLDLVSCVLYVFCPSSVPVVVAEPPHEAAAEETAAEHIRGTNVHHGDAVRL